MNDRPEMRLAHAPQLLASLRTPTSDAPLRALLSACIAGHPCGVDGTDYGMAGSLDELLAHDTIQAFPFCPEDHALGTPRGMPDLHDGDGFDVLDGKARALDQDGNDLSEAMIAGAEAMLAFAKEHEVEVALLTDMSGACGSQVISLGCRFDEPRRYQRGSGVASALLQRNGIPVVSQRDFRTLAALRHHLDPSFTPDPEAIDHHQTPWCRDYFANG